MSAGYKNWGQGRRAIIVGVTVVVFSIGFKAWVGHFNASAQTAAKAKANAEEIKQHEAIQGQLVEIVERLSSLHEAADAQRERDAELCLARKITDRDLCAAAGVELP